MLTVATESRGQEGTPAGHEVEWVYRVRPGFTDEWWRLFRTWEIPVLDEQQPEMHSSEEVRWDYRVIVTYRDRDGPFGEDKVARTVFRDADARMKGGKSSLGADDPSLGPRIPRRRPSRKGLRLGRNPSIDNHRRTI